MKGWNSFGLIVLMLIAFGAANAQASVKEASISNAEKINTSNEPANLTAATREFKSSSEAVIQLQEKEIEQASGKLEQLRQLVADGLVAKNELEISEQALNALKEKLAATRQSIAAAEREAAENKAAAELAKAQNAQLARSIAKAKTFVTPTMLRYNGPAGWSLANLASVRQFFSSRFGRALPTSAIGQSATHNRLGYDHRHAVDVALHPDSAEGKALIDFLRGSGIPFLAFRGAVPGVATGPHIHIGTPSHRLG